VLVKYRVLDLKAHQHVQHDVSITIMPLVSPLASIACRVKASHVRWCTVAESLLPHSCSSATREGAATVSSVIATHSHGNTMRDCNRDSVEVHIDVDSLPLLSVFSDQLGKRMEGGGGERKLYVPVVLTCS
jgi:hypothetical protein